VPDVDLKKLSFAKSEFSGFGALSLVFDLFRVFHVK